MMNKVIKRDETRPRPGLVSFDCILLICSRRDLETTTAKAEAAAKSAAAEARETAASDPA